MSSEKTQKLSTVYFDIYPQYCYTKNTNMEILKVSKIMRVGSSLSIVIPVNILSALNWKRGDFVFFQMLPSGSMVVTKLSDSDIIKLKNSSAGETAIL